MILIRVCAWCGKYMGFFVVDEPDSRIVELEGACEMALDYLEPPDDLVRHERYDVVEVIRAALDRENEKAADVSHGICPQCAQREYMALPGLGAVRLASPEQLAAGKAEELARFAPEGGE